MKSLIIPCSGQSSRMSKFFFPKCLLPLHQRPILFQIIECWKPYIDQIIIVHNKKNKNIIQNYMNEFFNNEHIKLSYCLQEKKSGTYFAIKKALRHCDNECMIWNWSDVCLKKNRKEPIFVTDKNTNYILTTDKQLCRWKFIENEFFHDTKMKLTKNGIYGIFIINDNSKIFLENYQIESENEREVLECLNPNSFRQYTWEKFYDIGDEKKYSKKLRCSQKEIRAFGSRNEIIFKNNQVIKYIHDEKLINCEKNLYKNANFSFIPRVISFEPFKLERLDAIPCCEKFDVETLTVEAEEKLIQKMFFILE
ncbi:MAG: hypothetical protein NTX92_08680, partial [Euryarchaeota archaeon]|nr:hypothetical protein [Euryarchaeota archaeon]